MSPHSVRIQVAWNKPEESEKGESVDWRLPALILAPLFLNAACFNDFSRDLPLAGPFRNYLAALASLSFILPGLLFAGPALASQRLDRPVFELASISMGRIPAILFRYGCVFQLALLSAVLLSGIAHLNVEFPAEAFTWHWMYAVLAFGLSAMLSLTATGSMQTCAKLGLFTSKLALAVMIAALLRVREHWAKAWTDLPVSLTAYYESMAPWTSIGGLLIYSAPLMFMAAVFARRLSSPKDVTRVTGWGLMLPFAAAMILAGFIKRAGYLAHRNFGHLAGFLSALNDGNASGGWVAKRLLIAITLFGVIRFAARASDLALPIPPAMRWLRPARHWLFAIAAGFLAGFPLPNWGNWLGSAACIVVAGAAVLTADCLTGRFKQPAARVVDWTGAIAWLSGASLPYRNAWSFPITGVFVGPDPMEWNRLWSIAPSYGLSFGLCLTGRLVEFCLRRVRLGREDPRG